MKTFRVAMLSSCQELGTVISANPVRARLWLSSTGPIRFMEIKVLNSDGTSLRLRVAIFAVFTHFSLMMFPLSQSLEPPELPTGPRNLL